MRTIMTEAQRRGVSKQELIRAVIIPEWVRTNLSGMREDSSRERTIERIVGLDRMARRQRHNGDGRE